MAQGDATRRWVLLLRGVNVGGRGKMPMADLRARLADGGFSNVRTYIQSGNVTLDASASLETDDVVALASSTMDRAFGFVPAILALTPNQICEAIDANPYRGQGDADGKTVHYFFVAGSPSDGSLDDLDSVAVDGDEFAVVDDVVYLHAPNGIGRSKLAAALSRRLGETTTARNHRSVLAVAELAAD